MNVAPSAVVLVEGASDRSALLALAARRGRDLAAEGVDVVAMGGATSIRPFLEQFGPHGLDVPLAGMCDAGEERHFRRAVEAAGVGTALDRSGMERLGFYVCERDLEDELIRCLGIEAVERVLEAEGDLASFRIMQQQPAHRARSPEQQLHRFLGTRSGRKNQYARLLVDALDLAHVPPPLDGVLAHV